MLSHPSPNFNARKQAPRIICVHATAGKSDEGDVTWCCNPASKVSYHAIIGRDGTHYSLVATKHRAWHAGVSEWQGVTDVNGISLGLAFANRHDGTEALTANQIHTARAVVKMWLRQYPKIETIVTHAEIAPDRKTDPNHIPNWYRPDWTLDAFRSE